jgi:hypothetical protein
MAAPFWRGNGGAGVFRSAVIEDARLGDPDAFSEPRLTLDVDLVMHLAEAEIAKLVPLFPAGEYSARKR